MKKKQSGVALVEFALILPFLLLLTFTVTEFGRAMYQYNTLTKSVRDAARYLSMQTPDSQMTPAQQVAIYGAAKNLVVYGNTAGTGNPLALGLALTNVPDPVWLTAGADPLINTVTISISGYTFHSLMSTAFGITFGNISFSTISATMRASL
jgi:hypothetical protein